METPQFNVTPEAHVASLTGQRNRALDQAALWEAVALQERQRVESLSAELMRLQSPKDDGE